MAIVKLIVGNLKNRKSYSIVICTLIFLAGFILTVTVSTSENAETAFDRAFNTMSGPHLLFSFYEQNFRTEYQTWFENSGQVQSVKLRKVRGYNGLCLRQGSSVFADSGDNYLLEYDPAENLQLIDAAYSQEKLLLKGEIYLPYIFKSKFSVAAGENIDVVFGAKQMSFTIAGFIEEPLSGGGMDENKFLFVSAEDFNEFLRLGGSETFRGVQLRIHLNTNDEGIANTLEKSFEKEFNPSINTVRTYSSFKANLLSLPDIALAVLIVLAILLGVITLTIMRYAILAMIEADYVNIGIIKALGFTPMAVQTATAGQYAVLALVSLTASFIAGILATPLLGQMILESSGLYFRIKTYFIKEILLLLVLALLISFFSYIIARHTRNVSPVRAIAKGMAPVYFSSRINVKLDRIGFLPFDIQMALKQVLTKSKRYLLLLCISIMLAYTLNLSFNIVDLFNSEKSLGMLGIELSDIELDTGTKAEAERIIADIERDYGTQWTYFQNTLVLELDDQKTVIRTRNGFELPGIVKPVAGRFPKHENEIMISNLLKNRLNKGIGDYIAIKDINGELHQYIVTGILQSLDYGGSFAMMLEEGVKTVLPDFQLNEAYIRLKNSDKLDEVIEEMKNNYTGYQEISSQRKQSMDSLNTIKSVFSLISRLILAATISMIALITFLVMKITVYGESKELGIYKAIGFSAARIRFQLSIRLTLLTAAGAFIGAVLAALSGEAVFSAALSSRGISSLAFDWKIFYILLPVAIIPLMALLAGYIASGNTKKVSVYSLINE